MCGALTLTLLSARLCTVPAIAASDTAGAVPASDAAGAVPAPSPSPELQRLLDLLADRAALHRALLYRFQCAEDLTRKVIRRPKFAFGGDPPAATLHERCGIVVEQGEDGVARILREKLDAKGNVRLNRKGEPVAAELPQAFNPIVSAVPHAQASTFAAQDQAQLEFHLLKDLAQGGPVYRMKCPQGHVAIEFLDRQPPRALPACSAQASGQMCVDPRDGEISGLVFYGMDRVKSGCIWNREAPFALVEQGLIEKSTGARFPSRMKTIFSLGLRDNAVFEQRFENCGFTHVDVEESYGGVAAQDAEGDGSKP